MYLFGCEQSVLFLLGRLVTDVLLYLAQLYRSILTLFSRNIKASLVSFFSALPLSFSDKNLSNFYMMVC